MARPPRLCWLPSLETPVSCTGLSGIGPDPARLGTPPQKETTRHAENTPRQKHNQAGKILTDTPGWALPQSAFDSSLVGPHYAAPHIGLFLYIIPPVTKPPRVAQMLGCCTQECEVAIQKFCKIPLHQKVRKLDDEVGNKNDFSAGPGRSAEGQHFGPNGTRAPKIKSEKIKLLKLFWGNFG